MIRLARPLLAAAVAAGALLGPVRPAAALTCAASYPTQSQRYVCGLYEDVLLRPPSDREVGYWADRVNRFPRRQTVESFEFSVEVMVEVAGDGYVDILGRESDPSGLGYWTDRLRGQVVTPEVFLRQLADSDEFNAAHPTSASVVDFWYQQVLGRGAEPGGRSYWIGRLDGGLNRSVLVAFLQESDEAVAKGITAAYQQIFQRNPEQAAVNGWSSFYRQQGSARLIVELAASDEAFNSAS